MRVEVDKTTYGRHFPVTINPFISEPFIELNSSKADRIIRLVDNENEPVIGLVAGIREGMIRSPFSAPFGGFHFKKENIYSNEIDKFLALLKEYAFSSGINGIEVVTPPDIYHHTFNAKIINSMIRFGFRFTIPDITNWVDLRGFDGKFSQKNSREYFRQAERNGLRFKLTDDSVEMADVYNLIRENRARFGRPIYMTLDDILATGSIWPADFFKIESSTGSLVASAIFYRSHPEISYAVFWGDNEEGRPLRAMDFLVYNLYSFYKNLDYKYIDLGISTEAGTPNEGLLRFKESHEAVSALRFRLTMKF